MGQKVNPVGLRIGIIRGWESKWFSDRNYRDLLYEDIEIRRYIRGKLKNANISSIEIDRAANFVRLTLFTSRPGVIIGRRGVGVENLKKGLEKLTKKSININVNEITHPELDAYLVASNVVEQLEKRVAFRRAMRQAVMRTMRAGAKGIKVECAGRLGGAEIARRERYFDGKVPLHTLRADIDFAIFEACTTYGKIGVKVWIYKGDLMEDKRHKKGKEKEDVNAKESEVPQTS